MTSDNNSGVEESGVLVELFKPIKRLEVRKAHNPEIIGSNPIPAILFIKCKPFCLLKT